MSGNFLRPAVLVATLASTLWAANASAAIIYTNDFETAVNPVAFTNAAWSLTPASGLGLTLDTARNSSTRYLGRNDTGQGSDRRGLGYTDVLTLTLSNLPTGGSLFLSFDLYTMLGWKGNGGGLEGASPDGFTLYLNNNPGSPLLSATFSNFASENTEDASGSELDTPGNSTNFNHSFCPSGSSCDGRTGSLGGVPDSIVTPGDNPLGNQDIEGGSAAWRIERLFSYTGNSLSIHFAGFDLSELLSTESWSVDNVSVSAVPVPPALPLLGTALLGLIGIARRRA